jgi:hypothetical protein
MNRSLVLLAVVISGAACTYVRSPTTQECTAAVNNRLRLEAAAELGDRHPLLGRMAGDFAVALAQDTPETERMVQSCLSGNEHQAQCEIGAMALESLNHCR